jgi:L-ascorbate metabolism protein UlaG (beta-lactamase superfamily)
VKRATVTGDGALERLLNAPELAADDALIALAERFAGCDRAYVLDRLDDAARALFGTATLPPRRQADLLADALTRGLGLRPVTHDHRALLIDRALESREAHPLVIAAIGHEVARRAGLTTRICQSHTDWWVAVPGDDVLTAIGCSAGTPLPGGPLRALCPHQLAYALLAHLGHDGPSAWHAHAASLIARLPAGHHDDAQG